MRGALTAQVRSVTGCKTFLCCIAVLLSITVFTTGADAAESITNTPDEQNNQAPNAPQLPSRLSQLNLEQLMNIEVTTVSRTESTVGESAAAVYVITQEDIRRSGATTIAELLRRVPGMNVARINNDTWAISARGFNDQYADFLLVQVDGRTVYNPLFGGVYWDSVVYPLEDIERIEVIRGPGASVWGANAVNGVINIITKSAKDTQGGSLSAGGGNQELGFGTLRYGGKFGKNSWYRVYGEGFDRLREQFSENTDTNDRWYDGDLGARVDLNPGVNDSLQLDTQYVHSRAGQSFNYPQPAPPFSFQDMEHEITDAGHILGKWTHTINKDSSLSLLAYWDHSGQKIENLDQHLRWDTYDLDFQHNLPIGDRQKFVYGFGYRLVDSSLEKSEIDNGFIFTWDHPRRVTNLFSAFAQDQIAAVKDKLSVLLGTKIEHNDFTGFEIQPTARLLWTPTAFQSAWAAVSRAVRTPALLEESILLTLAPVSVSPLVFPRITFNTDFESEDVIAYELGYRNQISKRLSVDTAVFYNDYHNLRVGVFGNPVPGPGGSLIAPLVIENLMRGDTYGLEVAANWQPAKFWRLYGAYSFLKMRLHADPSLPPDIIAAAESSQGHSPEHQVYIQSSWNFGRAVEFDLTGRYVSRLTGFNPGNVPGIPNEIDQYITVDTRVAWRALKNLEISLVGQNLFDNHHPEFISSPQGPLLRTPAAEINRSFYGMVKWNF